MKEVIQLPRHTVVAEPHGDATFFAITFLVFERLSPPEPLYWKKGWRDMGDWVEAIEDAEIWLKVWIKCDGCTHWSYYPEDPKRRESVHLCGLASIEDHIMLQREICKYAKGLMPEMD